MFALSYTFSACHPRKVSTLALKQLSANAVLTLLRYFVELKQRVHPTNIYLFKLAIGALGKSVKYVQS